MKIIDDMLTILIDTKKNRIRIHKKTLHALGDPESIMLIINPALQTFIIKCCSPDDRLAHKIPKNIFYEKVCYELISKSLVSAICSICPHWDLKSGYRIRGKIIKHERMVYFQMKDAIKINIKGNIDEFRNIYSEN